jgi:hypothetical protein
MICSGQHCPIAERPVRNDISSQLFSIADQATFPGELLWVQAFRAHFPHNFTAARFL